MADVGASFVRFYYGALANDDMVGLRAVYSATSQLSLDERKASGADAIVAEQHGRMAALGKVKFNITQVDSAALPNKSINVHVLGSLLTESTEHHFVQSFTLAATAGRDNTYFVLSEWTRTTNIVADRTVTRLVKAEAAPAAAAVAAAPAAPARAAAPAAAPAAATEPAVRERAPRERAPRAERPARAERPERAERAAAVAPAAAAAVAVERPERAERAERPRKERGNKRAIVAVEGIQKRVTIGDVEAACGAIGKVLAVKWRSRSAAGVEFLSLRKAEQAIASGVEIHGKLCAIREMTPEEFDAPAAN